MKTKPKKQSTTISKLFAYTISDDVFGEFNIQKSANAWWLDKAKVATLITAYKYDSTDEEACIIAGVSMDQLRYFKEKHPDFSQVKAACKQIPVIRARKHIVANLDKDTATARWYLERKKLAEFGQKQPLIGAQINILERIAQDQIRYGTV